MALLKGFGFALFIGFNTMLACVPLFLLALVRLCLPRGWREGVERRMDGVIDYWVGCNRNVINAWKITHFEITWLNRDGSNGVSRDQWYLVVSNHQSWTDILVLQTILFPHIPPLKFFTKQQLIWIPFLGVAMYALGFPYVRRVSPEQRERNPELKHRDRNATLTACKAFLRRPTSVLNFLEGTRNTPEKYAARGSSYQHLLDPKVGGLSYVMQGMGDALHRLLDVTIDYPGGVPTFWQFLQGKCRTVTITLDPQPIPHAFLAPMAEAETASMTRDQLAAWIAQLWQAKDDRLAVSRRP